MTGFGRAAWRRGDESVEIEVRSVNGRHLSVTWRAPEALAAGEAEAERQVRDAMSRGSVTVSMRCQSPKLQPDFLIDQQLLAAYREAFQQTGKSLGIAGDVSLDTLAGLPGVVRSSGAPPTASPTLWKRVKETLAKALAAHARARAKEGRALATDLRRRASTLAKLLGRIEKRVPIVVRATQKKIKARVTELLGSNGAANAHEDIAREAAMLAQRGDVTEECVRLRHHLKDLQGALRSQEAIGRKIDFLAQEMLREANTIGSKSGDAQIARSVVASKAEIDRIKEQAANLE